MKIKLQILFSILLFLLTGFFYNIYSQPIERMEEEGNKGKFYIAPDLGLMVGTITSIEVSPMLGYYLTERFSVAAGGRYEYYRQKSSIYGMGYKTNIWGIRSFARFDLIQDLDNIIPLNLNMGIFGHFEYEALNLDSDYFASPYSNHQGRFWLNTFLIGGGIIQQTSLRTAITFMALWDTNTTSTSPYINPIFRFGFQFYL